MSNDELLEKRINELTQCEEAYQEKKDECLEMAIAMYKWGMLKTKEEALNFYHELLEVYEADVEKIDELKEDIDNLINESIRPACEREFQRIKERLRNELNKQA